MSASQYLEWTDSQQPALSLLKKSGWKHLSPAQSEKERGDILSNVILESILEERLQVINSFEYKRQALQIFAKQYPGGDQHL